MQRGLANSGTPLPSVASSSGTHNRYRGAIPPLRADCATRARWFVVDQTVGEEFTPPRLAEWDAERALIALNIGLMPAVQYHYHQAAK